jgi:hypothetical protein
VSERTFGEKPVEVFVQIRPANTAVLDLDLDFIRAGRRFRHLFDPDIPDTVVNGLLHLSSSL